jgi:hypothetical protein
LLRAAHQSIDVREAASKPEVARKLPWVDGIPEIADEFGVVVPVSVEA